jgi:hypothetical protein
MELMIGEIFLKALVLCGILYLIARHEADFEFRKVALVTCGITLGIFALDAFLTPSLAYYLPYLVAAALTFLVAIIFVTFMVVRFCWVPLWKGIVVTIIFLVFNVGLSIAGALAMAKINQSVEKAGGSVMEKNNKEALAMFQEMMEQSSSEMSRQVKAESAEFMPALTNANVEAAPHPPAVIAAEERVEAPPQEPVEPAPPERPLDELPAFARTPEWQAAQAKIKVSAVLVERDGSNTAIVNGEVLGIGDVLTVEVKKKLYRFKMAEITTDWVAWDPLGEIDSD